MNGGINHGGTEQQADQCNVARHQFKKNGDACCEAGSGGSPEAHALQQFEPSLNISINAMTKSRIPA
jgi:hypothetical protein